MRLFFSHRPLDVYQTKVSPLTDQIRVSDVSYRNQTSIQTGYNLTKIVLVLMRAKQRMSGEYKCEVLLEVKCDRDSQNLVKTLTLGYRSQKKIPSLAPFGLIDLAPQVIRICEQWHTSPKFQSLTLFLALVFMLIA